METLDTVIIKRMLEDFISFANSTQNVLMAIGAIYTTTVGLRLTYRLCKSIWTYIIPRFWQNQDFVKRFNGKWAVVTGASEGIGRSYALKLAERKMNVLLISRSEVKLQSVAKEIEAKHGSSVQTICFPLDLGLLSEPDMYNKLKVQLDELDIGVLVNNVGMMFDRLMYFLTVPKETQKGVIDVNMTSLVLTTQLVLPQMVKRGNGAIINIGSGAGIQPTPFMSTYSASKLFVDSFTKAVNYEYADKGITMQCIQPFYVSTNMTNNAPPNFFLVDADSYVESAIRTLGFSGRNYGCWSHAIFGYLGEWLPEWFYMFAAVNINTRLWSWLTGVHVDTKKKI